MEVTVYILFVTSWRPSELIWYNEVLKRGWNTILDKKYMEDFSNTWFIHVHISVPGIYWFTDFK